MSVLRTLKSALKRGALVTAANWPVVVVQFVADTLFKALLAVPIVGGATMVVLLIGGDPSDLFRLQPGQLVPTLVGVLGEQPLALAAFLVALGLVVAGGSVLMFAVKAGSVSVLLQGERQAGPVEAPPLHLDAIVEASAWSIERFMAGISSLFGRYLRLWLGLAVVYVALAGAYLALVFGAPRTDDVDWTLIALVASLGVIILFTLVNFLYLLIQITMAAEDCGVAAGMSRAARLLRARGLEALGVLASVLALMLLSTAASILATAALGLIAFVPFVGLAALPLQIFAWLVRGVVFQYVGLTGLTAYATLHRSLAPRGAEAEQPIPEWRQV